jgi:hypothetical protein
MSLINKYNMIVWDDDGSPLDSCANEYAYPILEGDTIGFYINFFDNMATDASAWEVGWWVPNEIILGDIATLNEDVIDGTNRNLYSEVTVGVLPRSLLRLVIYDPDDSNAIKYWSRAFRFKTTSANTAVFKYRNYRNVLNYEFENVSAFYNQVRIDIRIGEPITTNDTEGYDITTGHRIRSKTVHRVTREFETQFWDEYAHQGFNAATEMSHFYFDGIRYERDTGAQYTQETVSKEYSFWLGRIRLEQYDYTAVASNT